MAEKHSRPLLLILCAILLSNLASCQCFYADGTAAKPEVPCNGAGPHCCVGGDACLPNGLCQQASNHEDGSLTSGPNGSQQNYTGLYYSGSCNNTAGVGCDLTCTNYGAHGESFVWACNSDLTSYCCAGDSFNNLTQGDCCNVNRFSLTSPSGTSPSSSTSSASPSATSSAAAAAAPAPTSSTTSTSSGLSSGAKAGIGVGVTLGVLALLCIAAFIWWRTRRQRSQATRAKEEDYAAPGHSFHAQQKTTQQPQPEMARYAPSEAPAAPQMQQQQQAPQELGGTSYAPAELPARTSKYEEKKGPLHEVP
ncbi:MAG: hypothetical protein M1828_000132 [Chrysothrix sp. TS-e1954]|nr:MAG: hypothetical protein M1828_000132 [Chrysothrix sp. TS-e1954]